MFTTTSDYAPDSSVLLLALDGWIDAGFGAANALVAVSNSMTLHPFATFAADDLLDMRSRRPTVRLVDGVNTEIMWPEISVQHATSASGTETLLLSGPEPDFHWQSFADAVTKLALSANVRMAVGFGAFPAPAPHTRPTLVVSSASAQDLAAQVGFVDGTLDVPAGIQAVLERTLGDAGIPSIGLWARVPHYVAGMPYPEASAALLHELRDLTGIEIDATALEQAAAETRARVDELIANSDEHGALVAQLEQQHDAEQAAMTDFGPLPTGDEIADELERFLREQP